MHALDSKQNGLPTKATGAKPAQPETKPLREHPLTTGRQAEAGMLPTGTWPVKRPDYAHMHTAINASGLAAAGCGLNLLPPQPPVALSSCPITALPRQRQDQSRGVMR